jgi:hypothetical protein
MKVVSPYRLFAPESQPHQALGEFDWISALRMLGSSVEESCQCQTFAITDVDTDLAVPSFQFETTERRLMLWILDVSLQYLKSPYFDDDTVMISPDTLVLGDLQPYFMADLGLVVRLDEKFRARPIINSAQWWRHVGKKRLIAFYEQALAIARTLPEDMTTWGADSESLRQLVDPIGPGVYRRSGLKVALIPMRWVMECLTEDMITQLTNGQRPYRPPVPILDFKYTRKLHMQAYFDATFRSAVLV